MKDPICTCGHPLSLHRPRVGDGQLVCTDARTVVQHPHRPARKGQGVADTFPRVGVCPCEAWRPASQEAAA